MFVRGYVQRWRLIADLIAVQLILWSLLRLVLYAAFHEGATGAWQLARILVVGAGFDLLSGLTALVPIVFLVSIFRLRWLGRRKGAPGVCDGELARGPQHLLLPNHLSGLGLQGRSVNRASGGW